MWHQSNSNPQWTWPNLRPLSLWDTYVIVIKFSIKDAVNQNGLTITGQQTGHAEAVGLWFISYVALNEESL